MRKRLGSTIVALILAVACDSAPVNVIAPSPPAAPIASASATAIATFTASASAIAATSAPPSPFPSPTRTPNTTATPTRSATLVPTLTPQATPAPQTTITPTSCQTNGPQFRNGVGETTNLGDCAQEVALVTGGRFLFTVTSARSGPPTLGDGIVDETLSVRVRGATGEPLWRTTMQHYESGAGGYFAGISTFVPPGSVGAHLIYYEVSHGASCCGFGGGVVAVTKDGAVREVLSVGDSSVSVTPCGTIVLTGPARYAPGAQAEFHYAEEYRWDGSTYVLLRKRLTPPPTLGGGPFPVSCDPTTGQKFAPMSCVATAGHPYIGLDESTCTSEVAVGKDPGWVFVSTTTTGPLDEATQTLALTGGGLTPYWSVVLQRYSDHSGVYFRGITTYRPPNSDVDHVVYFTEGHGASCCVASGGVIGQFPGPYEGDFRQFLEIDNGTIEITRCATILVTGLTGGSLARFASPLVETEYRWSGMAYVVVRQETTPWIFVLNGPLPTPPPPMKLSCDP